MPKQNKKKKKKKTEREHLSWCRIEPQRNRLAPTIQDRSGKCLTEKKKQEILSRWTEYYSELYSHKNCGNGAVLDCSQPSKEDLQPIFREDVKIAVASLIKGKSAGVDKFQQKLFKLVGRQ